MRICLITIVVASVACSEKEPGSHDSGPEAGPPIPFAFGGDVTDPGVTHPPVRVVVGIASTNEAVGTIRCTSFLLSSDKSNETLPSHYSFLDRDGLPAGEYNLVALLLPGSPRAPYALYPITLDAEGIHYHSGDATPTIDITIQGTVAYDCP